MAEPPSSRGREKEFQRQSKKLSPDARIRQSSAKGGRGSLDTLLRRLSQAKQTQLHGKEQNASSETEEHPSSDRVDDMSRSQGSVSPDALKRAHRREVLASPSREEVMQVAKTLPRTISHKFISSRTGSPDSDEDLPSPPSPVKRLMTPTKLVRRGSEDTVFSRQFSKFDWNAQTSGSLHLEFERRDSRTSTPTFSTVGPPRAGRSPRPTRYPCRCSEDDTGVEVELTPLNVYSGNTLMAPDALFKTVLAAKTTPAQEVVRQVLAAYGSKLSHDLFLLTCVKEPKATGRRRLGLRRTRRSDYIIAPSEPPVLVLEAYKCEGESRRLELRRKRGKNRTERAGSIPNIRSPEKKKLQKRGTLRKSKSAPICVTISRPAYDNPSANLDVEELVPLTRQQLLVAQAAAENMAMLKDLESEKLAGSQHSLTDEETESRESPLLRRDTLASGDTEGPSSPLASHPSTDASPLDRFRRRPSPLKLVLPPPPVAPIKAEGPEGTTPGPPTPSRGASGALKDPDELLTVQASGPMKVLGQRGSSLLSFSAEAAETDGSVYEDESEVADQEDARSPERHGEGDRGDPSPPPTPGDAEPRSPAQATATTLVPPPSANGSSQLSRFTPFAPQGPPAKNKSPTGQRTSLRRSSILRSGSAV